MTPTATVPGGEDFPAVGRRDRRGLARWPLALIAAPAAVAVWSGWVGLGRMCGFGIVAPLPGIWDGLRIDTAVTLPIGVEAYAAYALGAWLAPGAPPGARTFARRSAVAALALGMAGQVIYHLLSAAHVAAAPWPVVTLVSCLPVATLGMAAALTHLLRQPQPVAERAQRSAPGDTVPGDLRAAEAADSVRALTGGSDGTDNGPAPGSAPQPATDRAAVVDELAAQVRAAAEAGRRWQPDYPALMTRTGFRRSWCEKAVRDARAQAAAGGEIETVPVTTDDRYGGGGAPPDTDASPIPYGPQQPSCTTRIPLRAVGRGGA